MTPTPFTAYDVAGAVVWPLAALVAAVIARIGIRRYFNDAWWPFPVLTAIGTGFFAIYCIARLMGVRG